MLRYILTFGFLLSCSNCQLQAPPSSIAVVQNEENGSIAYSKITVELTEEVPRHLCHRAIYNIQTLITSVSHQLFEASDRRGRFDKVIIILPEIWSNTKCSADQNGNPWPQEANLPASAFGKVDFTIQSDRKLEDGYDEEPWSIRFGGCGVRGHGVHIPHSLITRKANITSRTEIRTFQEWFRNRFGVFSESGFINENDTRFPPFYDEGPRLNIPNTGCQGLISQKHENQKTFTDINRQEKSLCEDMNSYNENAPTKQNLMCKNKSVKEIILQDPDFQSQSRSESGFDKMHASNTSISQQQQLNNFTQMIRNTESFNIHPQRHFLLPKFTYAHRSTRDQIIVLLLDISQAMSGDRIWEKMRHAVHRMIHQIPIGHELNIVTFGVSAKLNIQSIVVTQENREGLFGRIPFRLLNDKEGCVDCALRIATKLLSDNKRGYVVMVTASSLNAVDNSLIKNINDLQIPVFTVFISGKGVSRQTMSSFKYGDVFAVDIGSSNILQDMRGIFIGILNQQSKLGLIKFHEEELIWDGSKIIQGTFLVEENLRRNLWVIITPPFVEDVENFELINPEGRKYVFPKFDNGIVDFYHKDEISVPGVWTYNIRFYNTVHRIIPLTLEVYAHVMNDESKSNMDNIVTLRGWSTYGNGIDVKDKIIYAQLKINTDPIKKASVFASIRLPGSKIPFKIMLHDSGTGYPDITQGDGIYSAYLSQHLPTNPGLYGVWIHASSKYVAYISKGNSNNKTCTDVYFSRYVSHSAVYVVDNMFTDKTKTNIVINGANNNRIDIFPPSRITDLRVKNYINQTLYANLIWTAPGGNLDVGKADKYEIRCYTNTGALSDSNFDTMGIPVHESLVQIPDPYGASQQATVALPWANEIFYYGIVAIDKVGNRGQVSNLVPVYAVEVTVVSLKTVLNNEIFLMPSSNNTSINEFHSDSFASAVIEAFQKDVMMYSVAGVISGIVLIVLLIAIFTVCRSKKQNKLKNFGGSRNENEHNPVTISPLNQIRPENIYNSSPSMRNGEYNWITDEKIKSHSGSSPYPPEYSNYFVQANNPSISEQASWAFVNTEIPISNSPQVLQKTCEEGSTYQNWIKPGSDSGTATTECSAVANEETTSEQNSERLGGSGEGSCYVINIPVTQSYQSMSSKQKDPRLASDSSRQMQYSSNYHQLDSGFCFSTTSNYTSEKRRRQESLV